jgi:hypothetical protein
VGATGFENRRGARVSQDLRGGGSPEANAVPPNPATSRDPDSGTGVRDVQSVDVRTLELPAHLAKIAALLEALSPHEFELLLALAGAKFGVKGAA